MEVGFPIYSPTPAKMAFQQRMGIMLFDNRHWLDYDPVALAVLLIGIGCVELIVLSI